MTDRYASAALVAALLHAAAIALVIVFSLGMRVAPPATVAMPPSFFVLSPAAGAEEIADSAVRVSLPSLPKRVSAPVPDPGRLQEATSKNGEVPKPSAPRAAPQANRPPEARAPIVPIRATAVAGPRNATSLPRVSETWALAPAQPARSRDANTVATEREAYLAELRRRLLAALPIQPSLEAELETKVEMLLGADGSLSDPVIVRSSGSADFDRAVLAAIKRTRMPPPPGGRSEQIAVPFSTAERAR